MSKTAESRVARKLTLFLLGFGPLAASLGMLGGCAYGELRQVLRAQVASETSCGDVTVESSSVFAPGHKPNQFRVRGCGVDRTYDCPKADGLVSYGAKVCTYVDSKSIQLPGPTPPAAGGAEPGLEEPPLEAEPSDMGETP
jgi:hypothetical protein